MRLAPLGRLCALIPDTTQYFRYRTKAKEKVALTEQRRLFRERFGALQYLLLAV